MENSLRAARRTYALAVPFSSGPRGLLAKAGTWVENATRRIRGQPFRVFVHDTKAIEARIVAAGLKRVTASSNLSWYLAVYVRPEHPR